MQAGERVVHLQGEPPSNLGDPTQAAEIVQDGVLLELERADPL